MSATATPRAASRSRAGASVREPGPAKTVDEVRERRIIPERLRGGPAAGRELRVGDEKQLDLRAGFVEPAKLREACRQEAARTRPVGLVAAQRLDSGIIVARGILRLAEREIVPARRKGIQPECALKTSFGKAG